MSASTSDTNEILKQILGTVNELKSTQNKIISTINSCRESNKTQEKKYVIIESKLNTLSNQLAEVISENKTLRAKIEQIEDKITTLETAASPGANVESVYSEIMDRQSRAHNIIFFNIQEFNSLPDQLTDTLVVDEILKSIALLNYDLIILTEIWLSRSVNDSDLGLCPHYTVFRCDRYKIHGPDIQGGVLIAIKVQYPCHRLIIQEDLVEQLFVKIHINSIFGYVYFPPRSDLNLYNSHVNVIDNLKSKYYNDKFLVLGDYNLTNVNWVINNQEIIPRFSNNNLYESNILSALSYVNLMQNNLIHNSSGSLLDLVFSNIVNVNVTSETSPRVPLDYKYHPALKITLPLSSTKNNLCYNVIVHDFINCDYNVIRSCMASTDWSCTFKGLHINEALDVFYSKLHDINCQKKRMFSSKYPL
ncbi:hypothetical protein QTP88_029203 [Uroleucon formosanum]